MPVSFRLLSSCREASSGGEATRGQFPNLARRRGCSAGKPRDSAASGRFVQDEALPAQGGARGEAALRRGALWLRLSCVSEARLELLRSEEPGEVHRDRESSPEGSNDGCGTQRKLEPLLSLCSAPALQLESSRAVTEALVKDLILYKKNRSKVARHVAHKNVPVRTCTEQSRAQ